MSKGEIIILMVYLVSWCISTAIYVRSLKRLYNKYKKKCEECKKGGKQCT